MPAEKKIKGSKQANKCYKNLASFLLKNRDSLEAGMAIALFARAETSDHAFFLFRLMTP